MHVTSCTLCWIMAQIRLTHDWLFPFRNWYHVTTWTLCWVLGQIRLTHDWLFPLYDKYHMATWTLCCIMAQIRRPHVWLFPFHDKLINKHWKYRKKTIKNRMAVDAPVGRPPPSYFGSSTAILFLVPSQATIAPLRRLCRHINSNGLKYLD